MYNCDTDNRKDVLAGHVTHVSFRLTLSQQTLMTHRPPMTFSFADLLLTGRSLISDSLYFAFCHGVKELNNFELEFVSPPLWS